MQPEIHQEPFGHHDAFHHNVSHTQSRESFSLQANTVCQPSIQQKKRFTTRLKYWNPQKLTLQSLKINSLTLTLTVKTSLLITKHFQCYKFVSSQRIIKNNTTTGKLKQGNNNNEQTNKYTWIKYVLRLNIHVSHLAMVYICFPYPKTPFLTLHTTLSGNSVKVWPWHVKYMWNTHVRYLTIV